jgi:DNA gyrase subunit A
MGRTASGVRGITLSGEDDIVIGMITVLNESEDVLVVSENGYGKRSSISDYRITNRGGKGVKTINVTDKTGKLIALKDVTDQNDLMIITQGGNILRIPVNSLRVMGRATQGVRLINLKENDSIASVAYVEVGEEDTAGEGEISDTAVANDE